MIRHSLAAIAATLLLAAVPAPSQAQPVAKPADTAFGVTKSIPVYLQELHVWWSFPYPDDARTPGHLETSYTSYLEPWRLQWNRNGYPYVGIYDSRNMEIFRWQIRCIKATGITSVAVMIHPDMDAGLDFIQERKDFAQDNFIRQLLDVAAQEKFPVFFMDEVAFRNAVPPKDPKVMAQRIIRFMKNYGSHPGFYKIDGKPVYYYQTFGYWVGAEKTQQMMVEVEAAVGPVYWMIFGSADEVGKVPLVKAIICGANTNQKKSSTRVRDIALSDPNVIFAAGHKLGKKMGDMEYPKFDGTSQPWRVGGVSHYGMDGKFIEATITDAMKAHPDLLMVSSWNDWEEGANFEPGWDFDGFNGDPFMYCRLLAKLRGVEFVPPPSPPKGAVHPSIWEKLGYGDGAGPIIDSVRRTHVRGGSLEVIVRDTASAVAELEVVPNGDLWWRAAQPGEKSATGNLILVGGSLGISRPMPGPLGFQVGNACGTSGEVLKFKPAGDPSSLGENVAIGVAYATDAANPVRPVHAYLPRKIPVNTGGKEEFLLVSPSNKAAEVGSDAWIGWQAGVAQSYAPVNLTNPEVPIRVDARGCDLASVSLLGSPKAERFFKTPPVKRDAEGRCVSYYVTLTPEQLDKPGVFFLWLRAKDSVGNWGSPKLYAVPNYESPSGPPIQASVDFAVPKNAVLADPMLSAANWKVMGMSGAKVQSENQVVRRSCVALGETVLGATFGQQLDGSFIAHFKIMHTEWQRGAMVWITDEGGGKGYGVLWDSQNADANHGQGTVMLLKLDQTAAPEWTDRGTPLGERVPSGHPAMQRPFAQFVLRRDGATGNLTLEIDGKVVATATDKSTNRFARIFLRGNTMVLFNDVVVQPAD